MCELNHRLNLKYPQKFEISPSGRTPYGWRVGDLTTHFIFTKWLSYFILPLKMGFENKQLTAALVRSEAGLEKPKTTSLPYSAEVKETVERMRLQKVGGHVNQLVIELHPVLEMVESSLSNQ